MSKIPFLQRFLVVVWTLFQRVYFVFFRTISRQGLKQSPRNMGSGKMEHIVVLGGSFAGISTAHRILKQSVKTKPFKITLVSPNTHLYWSMASPRGVIPGQLTDEQLFQPIQAGFKKYTSNQFEFVLGSAEALDVDSKVVEVSSSTEKRKLHYDMLIIATGSRTKEDTPFKAHGTTEAMKNALHTFQARVQKAKTIVVAGAGVTGVEVAGELGYEYGREKNVMLIASESKVLDATIPSVSMYAAKALQDLNVEIKLQTKVKEIRELSDGVQELALSDGSKVAADLYIPTFGLTPNTSYIPAKFLNDKGEVKVDKYMRVKGADGVFALGDVTDLEGAQLVICDRQSTYLAKALTAVLSNKAPSPYKPLSGPFMGLQIGKKAGTGQWGTWKLPTFLIVWARKGLFIDRMAPMLDGSAF